MYMQLTVSKEEDTNLVEKEENVEKAHLNKSQPVMLQKIEQQT